MAAEFLFVICKEDSNRLIKYTGYGNAAGLLLTHGLLGNQCCFHGNMEVGAASFEIKKCY